MNDEYGLTADRGMPQDMDEERWWYEQEEAAGFCPICGKALTECEYLPIPMYYACDCRA